MTSSAKPKPKYKPGRGKFAILGLGNFGTTVGRQLQDLGNDVLAVDRSEERVNALADQFQHVVAADVSDQHALEELGLGDFDVAVVAIGENLESNILCTLALKQLGTGRVWVKAVSPQHHHILAKIGADRIVHPEFEIGVHIAYSLNYPFVIDYISLGSNYFVVELTVTEKMAETPLADIQEHFQIRLLAIRRGDDVFCSDLMQFVLQAGDRLVILGKQDQLRKFGDLL